MIKTILITGSTDGIGKLAATKLAKDGHQIYVHGRNPEKLSLVIEEIKQKSGNENINGFTADFSDLEAVKNLASTIKNEIPKIDVFINNAGVFKSPINHTKAGLDIRFVVNYLAPFLLTTELLPQLQKGAPSRIINLSSAAQSPVSLEALAGTQPLSPQESYAQSKLALTMWSFYLAKTLNGTSVIAVNPGSLLNTKMVREGFGRFWSSADKGGNILYDLAVSSEYEGVTGKYFDNDKGNDKGTFGDAHPAAYENQRIEDLITFTKGMLAFG